MVGEVDHPPLEERVVLDRQQAGLVCPVLEDSPRGEQARDDLLLEAAYACCERDAVRPVDGRDRIELNGAEPTDLSRDLACPRPPCAGRVALVGNHVLAELGQLNRAHAGER